MYCCNFNWNIVPMTFNESYTYMEMLGKVTTQAATNATNIATNTAKITTLQSEMSQAQAMILSNTQALRTLEGKVDTLETKMTQVQVDIQSINNKLAVGLYKGSQGTTSATPTVDIPCQIGQNVRIDFLVGIGLRVASGSMWVTWIDESPIAYNTSVVAYNDAEAYIIGVSGLAVYVNTTLSVDFEIDGVMLVETSGITTPIVPSNAQIMVIGYQISVEE